MAVFISYFVHGTTTDNEAGLATGWLPGELSENGKQQTLQLKQRLSDQKFDVVYSSDLKRAVDSARILFADKYEIIQDKHLRECNYGDLNGKPVIQFKGRLEDFIDKPFPNGESYKDVEERLANFIEFLGEYYEGKHVAVVAHQGPQLALDVLLKGKTWQQAIDEDWRKTKTWQPGWPYEIKEG